MKLELTEEKEKEITNFLIDRFKYFQDLRRELDNKIIAEIEIYNDYDKSKDDLTDKEKETIPYVYTIVQTMVARLIDTFFSKKNYLKIYVENKKFKKIEKSLREWIQSELDVMKFSARARDFIEESLIQRTVWLEPRPVLKGKKLQCIDFNILKWFDVWFDTGAKTVNESDFFVRKVVPYYTVMQNEKIYFNLDKIAETNLPDNMRGKQEYKAKHGGIIYYDPEKNNVTDKVELLEYSGVYDTGKEKNKPKFENVLFVLANRELLIRAEKSDLDTKQKILLFPIRPLKQANSLIGKSVPQITKKMAETLNEVWQLLLRNFRIIVKLLFKYKKDAGIDLDELFADGGNAISYEDNPNDVSIFETKNIVQIALILLSQIIQIMQQLTGAVDYLMGTTAGRGVTETAAGIKQITEQAMFKFSMMAVNIYNDLLDFITFCIILWSKYVKSFRPISNALPFSIFVSNWSKKSSNSGYSKSTSALPYLLHSIIQNVIKSSKSL